MQLVSKSWLRALLLTSIYLLGTLGIIASGGGGGGGGDGFAIGIYEIDPPLSPTYAPETTISGRMVIYVQEDVDYPQTIKSSWQNHLTGESQSGTSTYEIDCYFNLSFEKICDLLGPQGDFSNLVPLAVGNNRITFTVESEASYFERTINVVRLDNTIPPKAPINVSIATTIIGAIVTWDNLPITESPLADSYNIYYASSPGVTKTNYLSLPDGTKITGATSSQDVAALANGTSYYFVVTSVNAYGESTESIEVKTSPPAAPSGVSIQTTGNGAVVSWEPVAGAFAYNIYFASSPGVTKTN